MTPEAGHLSPLVPLFTQKGSTVSTLLTSRINVPVIGSTSLTIYLKHQLVAGAHCPLILLYFSV